MVTQAVDLRTGASRSAPTAAAAAVVAVLAVAAGAALAALGAATNPALIVLLPAAALWTAAVFQRTVWGVAAFFVLMPFGLERLPVGDLAIVDVVAVAAVGITVLARLARSTSTAGRLPASLGWGLGLCALATLSVPSALNSGQATDQLIVLLVAFGFACAVVVACERLADVRLLAGIFLATGSIMAVTAFGNAREITGIGGAVVQSRSTGLFVDPNELGSFAAMLLMMALAVMLSHQPRALRALGAVAAASATAALVLSLSRGAWIGTGLGLVGLAVFMPRARWFLGVVGVVGVALGLTIGAFAAKAPEVQVVSARFGQIIHPTSNPYDMRQQIWAEAEREIAENPWLGVGPGNFPTASARSGSDAETVSAVHAHDVLLTVGAELGLPAVGAVIGFTIAIAFAARRAGKALRRSPDGAIVAGAAAGLLTFLGHGVIDYTLRNPTLMVLVWALAGLVLASDRVSRMGPRAFAR